jgi:AraC family transcriptional regulator
VELLMASHAAIERVDIATGRRVKICPGAVQRSSGDLWRGIRLDHRRDVPGEVREGYTLNHVIVLLLSSPIPAERYWPGRGWKPQRLLTRNMQIFPARVPYAVRWDGCAESLMLEVAPEFVAAIASREAPPKRLELLPFATTEDPFITQTMLALEDDMRAGSPTGRLYGESLGIALAAHLVRRYTGVTQDSHRDTEFSKEMLTSCLQFIGDNLETNLSLQDLADLVQMDVYRFLRSFKQSTGLPPHQYILRERIERAKSLLGNPALPLTEVALRSGFVDQSHLTNAFRRMTNLSPGAYRKAVA